MVKCKWLFVHAILLRGGIYCDHNYRDVKGRSIHNMPKVFTIVNIVEALV